MKEIPPEGGWLEVVRESQRPGLAKSRVQALEGEQGKVIVETGKEDEIVQKILLLSLLRGFGAGSAWLLVMDKIAGSDFEQPQAGREGVSHTDRANNFSAGDSSRIGVGWRAVRGWTRRLMTVARVDASKASARPATNESGG